MICRPFSVWPDFDWLLIGQPEHARISAELARHWVLAVSERLLRREESVREEVLESIRLHDDGWHAWERAPEIDPQLRRPLSYRGEVALSKTIPIWGNSIAAARSVGPLGGYLVAQHFLRLLQGSHTPVTDDVREWRQRMDMNCEAWLREWEAGGGEAARSLAEEGVAHLQYFDRLSLWMCCDCALAPKEEPTHGASFELDGKAGSIAKVSFRPVRVYEPVRSADGARVALRVAVSARPWPFDQHTVSLDGIGVLVPPVTQEVVWNDLVQHCPRVEIRWDFVPSGDRR